MAKISGIYKITNNINGKIYIGQSININKRFLAHRLNCKYVYKKHHLYNAIKKYGIDNFTFSIIATLPEYALDHYEKQYILYYNTLDNRYGYNKSDGGSNGVPNVETRKKMSNAAKARISPTHTTPHTKETRLKISLAITGKKYNRISGYKCKSKNLLFDGKIFNNKREIFEYLNISNVTLNKRIRLGMVVITKGESI